MTVPPEQLAELQRAVLAWYGAHGRSLPFRRTRDPYAILVSEVMLQQTQVGRVGEAWARFLERFPTFEALAAAAPGDVLRAWAGLGYNRRALNLKRLARTVVAEYGGRLPADVAKLLRLPGVGPYTARAVAAIAFDQREAAVDTNVRRVLGRLSGRGPSKEAGAIQSMADGFVPADRPAEWTHALMDIGATLCRIRDPACSACPLEPWCIWSAEPTSNARGVTRRSSGQPFVRTSRWLRGRILDRLRQERGSAWITVDPPVGAHDASAVEKALEAMRHEGLLERHPRDARLVRLPQ